MIFGVTDFQGYNSRDRLLHTHEKFSRDVQYIFTDFETLQQHLKERSSIPVQYYPLNAARIA